MKRELAVLAAIFCASAYAQNSIGYAYFAPGGITSYGQTTMTLQMGVGGEAILGKGIGIGGDVGAFGPREGFVSGVLGVLSPNLSYHFIHGRWQRADPFVIGGYTMLFRSGVANLTDFGAGVNFWFARRVGLRVEFRDQVYIQSPRAQMWGLRLGIAFR